MATFSNNLVAKSGKSGEIEYYCEKCDYRCFKKYNWDKHLITAKHCQATFEQHLSTEKWQKVAKSGTIYCCKVCGKKYNDRSGLWRHNQKCKLHEIAGTTYEIEEPTDKELIMSILKQNSELIKENLN